MKFSAVAVELLLKIKGDLDPHFWIEIVNNYAIISPVESALGHSLGELKSQNSGYSPCSNSSVGIILSKREDCLGDGWEDLMKYQPPEETELEDDTSGG